MYKYSSLVNMLAEDSKDVAPWISSSFPIIKIVLAVLICLCSILIIVFVLTQKTEDQGGTNAITGQADTFYNRNKGESLQGKVKKATVALAIVMFVLCVLYLIVNIIYGG